MMKNEIQIYTGAQNGLSLNVIPETDEEEQVLLGLWRHGRLELVHPGDSGAKRGYSIQWSFKGSEE